MARMSVQQVILEAIKPYMADFSDFRETSDPWYLPDPIVEEPYVIHEEEEPWC